MKYYVESRWHNALDLIDYQPDRAGGDTLESVHVFTDAELRARDERIIRATLDVDRRRHGFPNPGPTTERVIDLIIGDAEGSR